MSHVAVIDIGKTNAKLALVNLSDLSEIAVITRPNRVLKGPPYPHFDVEGHWDFLLDGLARFQAEHGIDAISITTHGACAALLNADGKLAAPILDYEFDGPDETAAAYDALRPPFDETGSPRLAGGLNIGAQLHWQFSRDPGLKARTKTIVTYPQYWGHRLTGVAATDVTSLGCHTDLWNPHEGRFSSLVDRLEIADKIAPAHRSADILGPILPEIATRTGLPADTPVHCGIHDSNASLLPHILTQTPPFSVVSSGTWTIAMSIGGQPVPLDPDKDVLINVNAQGAAVPSARFMGGREHDLATGGPYPEATEAALAEVLDKGIILAPAVVPETGPFRGCTSRWIGPEPRVGSAQRGVAVALYLALVTKRCLELVGHRGVIIVEGPFARNRIYLQMLSAATGCNVVPMVSATGTSQGAALLVKDCSDLRQAAVCSTGPQGPDSNRLKEYAGRWAKNCC
ncbi:FGGY-family carbohydrate kinase [Tropicibacter oceani]|uniref:FGGY-family carbohydrate kinase n=1 Tax=Tropicibacter oceani TaxID=3058420 RepID=A0ABY8QGL7_9RHOB|nr:FGGY-family carbohydrate kinase [Tropicibacter oceani]WGW03776.1 FGGY-family carbohydrate kinase [Tropicibacter oceani]